jgi:diadenosine tetraphosphate (Ap4A) HIT family hydrolase
VNKERLQLKINTFFDTSYTGESRPRYQKRGHHGQGGGGDFKQRRYNDGGQQQQHQQREPREPPGPCWFCLASPEVEKHLIVSIGDAAYLTLAKGGMTNDHVLILPIGHFRDLLECPQEVVDEVHKFKTALKKFFATQGKAAVFFERNYKSPHLQIQVVPIPQNIADSLKFSCLDYAEAEGIEMQEFPPNSHISQMTRPGFPYFCLELPDETKLFVAIKRNFPVQFGRELLASPAILKCEEKIDWKACKVTKEEETRLTKDFREAFKPFDPTLE